jgi:proteasome alpha subunit
VEVLVAELGTDRRHDQLYHIAYEGTITDEDSYAVLGGETETITTRVAAAYVDGWDLDTALRAAVSSLAGPDRTLGAEDLEVAVLARTTDRRAFRRLGVDELAERLAGPRRTGRGSRAAAPATPPDGGTSPK